MELFCKILVDGLGHVHDRDPDPEREGGVPLGLLAGDLAVNADDTEKAEDRPAQVLEAAAARCRNGDPFDGASRRTAELLEGLRRALDVDLVRREDRPLAEGKVGRRDVGVRPDELDLAFLEPADDAVEDRGSASGSVRSATRRTASAILTISGNHVSMSSPVTGGVSMSWIWTFSKGIM